eukprot:4583364-Ditylum_brightwellii.AAC.1
MEFTISMMDKKNWMRRLKKNMLNQIHMTSKMHALSMHMYSKMTATQRIISRTCPTGILVSMQCMV